MRENIFYRFANKEFIVPAFFLVVLFVGFYTFRDFGITWDEEISRSDNGQVVYDFMTTGAKDDLLNGNEKYHGPAFEIFLYFLEKKLDLRESQDVYFMRHLVTYLVFLLALWFFYRFVSEAFKSWKWGLFACLVLLLTPRLFPEAFYNSKDHAFLSFYLISAYFTWRFIKKTSYLNALWLAFFLGVAIDIRILGIILVPFIPVYLILEYLIRKKKGLKVKSKIPQIAVFLVLLCGFIILFWPVLWIDPLHHFKMAFKEMSLYHWNYEMLFMGEKIMADSLPWYYLPVWIGISVPPLYLFFFFTGLVFIILKFGKIFDFFTDYSFLVLCLFSVFAPLLSVIILDSIVYDAWRHVFFIFPFVVFIMMSGIREIYFRFSIKTKYKTLFALGMILFIAGPPLYSMIRLHPYQNLYFNVFAGNTGAAIKSSYEMDYWGSSAREGLEFVCKNDTSKLISVFPGTYPVELSGAMLDKKDRGRIVFLQDSLVADYFIGHYRFMKTSEYNFGEKIYSRDIEGAPVMTVIRMNTNKRNKIRTFFQDFENLDQNNMVLSPETAPSGTKANFIGPSAPFGFTYTITNDTLVSGPGLSAKISLAKYELTEKNESTMVVSVNRSGVAEPYFYFNEKLRDIGTNGLKEWKWKQFLCSFPDDLLSTDEIRIYVMSNEKSEVLIDNFKVEIIKSEL